MQLEILKNIYQKSELLLDKETESLMLNAPWKGNFRELKNCLEYMVVVSDGLKIKKDDFPPWFLLELDPGQSQNEFDFISHFPEDFNQALASFEEWYLKSMFERFSGRVNETARILRISKSTLINKAKKYQINTLQMRNKAHIQKSSSLVA